MASTNGLQRFHKKMKKYFYIAASVVIVSVLSGCGFFLSTGMLLAGTKGRVTVVTLQGEHAVFDVRVRKHDDRILLKGLSPEDERRAVTVWVTNIGEEAIGTNARTWRLDILDNPPEDVGSWNSSFKRIVIAPGERKFLYRGPLAGLHIDHANVLPGGPRWATRLRLDLVFDKPLPKPIRAEVGWERFYP